MKVLVTAGYGFIGSYLVEELFRRNYDITVIDITSKKPIILKKNKNLKIKFIKADISKKNKWYNLNIKYDAIIHLASPTDIQESINNPSKYFNTIMKGTLNTLEFAKKNNIKRFINIASASCYGIADKYPTTESAKIKPQYPYALFKYLSEEMCLHWSKVYKLDVISLRLFNTYGPNSSGTFGKFIELYKKALPLTITGKGDQSRDFIHVKDITQAIILSLKNKNLNGIFNVGTGKKTSMLKLAQMFSNKIKFTKRRKNEMNLTHANIDKIKKKMNWKQKYTLKETIAKIKKDNEKHSKKNI